ncbi:MAG: S8 family serine peptidase [Muribaculaceae bacterium]|nr:S8 family serine peptidase [Muribaculaceae bacterium]
MKRYILILTFLSSIIPFALSAAGAEPESRFIPRIIKIVDESEIDSLAECGVEMLRRRGDILLCLFPDAPTRSGQVHARVSRPIIPVLDESMRHYDAGSIQSGAATGTPFTGRGVVVGICDIGIDPLHPVFLDADGRSRIKRVVQYIEQEGIRLQLDGDDEYRNWVTDNPDMYHATHVCGILAGGGAGTPYVGVAPDAEIVATVSTLTEVGLLAGVEDIIDYAKEVGKPAVINISVGSYTGPHDGSSLFSQYLDMCGEDAFIVLSAGNEGSHKNTLLSEFSPARRSVSFRLGNTAWDQYHMYGMTDIWSGSSSPLSVSLGLYDTNEKKIERWLEPCALIGGETRTYLWGGGNSDPEAFPFEGELTAIGYVDSENGRHCTSLVYDFTSVERACDGEWARYVLAVEVSGEAGEDVEVYADGSYTRLYGLPGSPAPSSDLTISDLACGFNVISVGMYGNRDSVPRSHPQMLADDEIFFEPTGYGRGSTVVHSSYGTLRDGRVLPLTVAPGATLMSAGSRPFLEANPFHPHLRLGGSTWIDEGGTSMSAPYVAGYIATWLEAVPTLSVSDVRRIIASTNRIDIPDSDDPHNAAGFFDPVAALRLAIRSAGIDSVEDSGIDVSPDEYVEVYDVAGVKRYAGVASGLSGMEKGLYVVRAPRGVGKMVLR